MRHLSLFKRSLIVAAPLALALSLGVHAAPDKKMEVTKRKTNLPSKVGDIQVEKATNRTAIGEKYRLWLSINATDCNDPALLGNGGKDDYMFELYGELRVNDKVEWKVVRLNNGAAQPGLKHLDLPSSTSVDPRLQGFSLNRDPFVIGDKHEIKVDTSKNRSARITLQLFDKDDPQGGLDYNYPERDKADRKDDKIGDYKIDLDLGALGKNDGRYYWFWSGKDESGNSIGTNLYLYAEHVGTVYGNTTGDLRRPQIDPKIETRKLPGGVGGPGPVSNQPNRWKTNPPAPKLKPAPERVAKGRQVKISARFVVTNSDDGVADSIVELVGSIHINGIQAFSFDKTKASVGKEFRSERAVSAAYYYGGNGSFTSVRGVIKDHDKASGNDTLWVADQKINLQQILESQNEFLIKGDRDSESGDLYIRVEDRGEFYD